MNKDINYYQNQYPGLLIKESTGDLKGYRYSCTGADGYWAYADDISFFENNKYIEKDLKDYRRTLELLKVYPYLYISPHGIWVRSLDFKRDGVSTCFQFNYKGFSFYNLPEEVEKLNKEAMLYHENPTEMFFCSICCKSYFRQSLTVNNVSVYELLNSQNFMNQFGGKLDAGVYCNLCLQTHPYLKKRIEEKANQYD